MPFNTDLTVPQGEYSPGLTTNPLGLANSVMDLQSRALQQQQQGLDIQKSQLGLGLLQKELNARTIFGQTMANAKTAEDGLKSAYANPDLAPYIGEWANQVRQGLLTTQQYENESLKGTQSGFETVLKAAAAAADSGDEKTIAAAISGGAAQLPPHIRAQTMGAMQDVVKSWTNGAPDNTPDAPTARGDYIKNQIINWGLTHQVSPETVQAILGKPGMQETPTGYQPYVQAPVQKGGGVTLAGPEIPKGLGPQRDTSTGTEFPAVSGPNIGTQNPNAVQKVLQQFPPPKDLAGDGKPLISDPTAYITHPLNSAGQAMLNPVDKEGASKALERFQSDGAEKFAHAQDGMARAVQMDADMDRLNKDPAGWQSSGPLGDLRNSLASFAQKFAEITKQPLPFDAQNIASWESFAKNTMPAALDMVAQSLGQQREAATTIQSSMRSVPSIENTYLGGKLVNTAMMALFQRAMDERAVVDYQRKVNGGDIQQAELLFNKEHPATEYARQALAKFGLIEKDGVAQFPDKASLVNAVRHGWVKPNEAMKIKTELGFN